MFRTHRFRSAATILCVLIGATAIAIAVRAGDVPYGVAAGLGAGKLIRGP